MPATIDLSSTAMLASLKISNWTASVCDKDISQEVLRDHGADAETGRFTKKIIKKDGLKKIREVVTKARAFHRKVTLPWGDGTRILPAKMFLEFRDEMAVMHSQFDTAVHNFVGEYENLKAEAYGELGTLYSEQDYPDKQELANKFKFDVDIAPMPNADDFRVNLNKEAVDAIRKEIEENTQRTLQAATKSIWQDLFTVVERMQIKLSDTDAKFKNTLIGNIEEILGLLPSLNITDDPALTKMGEDIRDKLCTVTPDELRKNSVMREQVAKDSEAILQTMAGYCN